MTGDYMLLLILCIPFAGALVTLLLRGGEKGAGESSDGKKKRDIWTGLITAAEMLIFASLFVIFLAGGRTGKMCIRDSHCPDNRPAYLCP